ncbi:MAG TPA: DNA-processing protein DprA [Thermoanaerobaculia bacterium]|nr:DNA-processing protein DprA [Thermoanaerobaculia bacterium]
MPVAETARLALAWSKIPGLSLRRFWKACDAAGGWRELVGGEPSRWAGVVRSETAARLLARPFDVDVSAEVAAAERSGFRLLNPFEGAYPALLREIPDAPLVLWAAGDPERLALPAVAIVGARAATRYGREVAARIAADLSLAGVCIVSGMARGVDAAAHAAAIGNPGGTIAVLGSGVDVPYPKENAELWRRIAADGLVLSEQPPGTRPLPANFPVRNRVIAGMASGIVVVEAARRSGSLITARLANDFGRDVFAVPGSIRSESSDGCHALLRDGAILCRGAEDVLTELFPSVGTRPVESGPAAGLEGEAARVVAAMAGDEAWDADDLAEATQIPTSSLLAILFDLEARGVLRCLPGGLYALAGGGRP